MSANSGDDPIPGLKSTGGSEMEKGMWREFVEFAERKEESFSAICARFGVSRKTGYKWLNRFRAEGPAGLVEQSRRPKNSPRKTPEAIEELVFDLRQTNPDWSAARIAAELQSQDITPLPAPSTIDLILRRRRETASLQAVALGPNSDRARFEPNYRWSLRFGRELKLAGTSVLPVLAEDDTTRFIVGVQLPPIGRREEMLLVFLRALFERHGLPWRLALPTERVHTALTVWLMRLGIGVDFAPQSEVGENARSQQLAARLAALPAYQRVVLQDRTLPGDWFEPLQQMRGASDKEAAKRFEQMREQHNFSGGLAAIPKRSPISLYRRSARLLPDELPEVLYPEDAELRQVSEKGIFTFQRRLVHLGRAFAGLEVELKPTSEPERYFVLFARHVLGQVDLAAAEIDETTSLPLHAV